MNIIKHYYNFQYIFACNLFL